MSTGPPPSARRRRAPYLLDGLWAATSSILSDLLIHRIVTRFAYGDNFRPENTLFARLPLGYPPPLRPTCPRRWFGPIHRGLSFHSFSALSLVAVLSIWAFIRRLAVAPSIATLGTLLFLFGAPGFALIATGLLLPAAPPGDDAARTSSTHTWRS